MSLKTSRQRTLIHGEHLKDWAACSCCCRGTRPSFSGLCFSCLGKHSYTKTGFKTNFLPMKGENSITSCCVVLTFKSAKSRLLVKEILVSEALGVYFSWIMIASIKLMTRTMDGWLIMNKLRRRRVKLCQRVMATLQCKVSKCEHFDRFVFLPHPSSAPLSPNITWAREATHSELRGTKRVNLFSNQNEEQVENLPKELAFSK